MQLIALLLLSIALTACSTPYSGDPSLLGGASHTKLGDNVFEVRATVNGFSPPGLLKPMILRQARKIASDEKFKYFEIESVSIVSDLPRSGIYRARARIKMLIDARPDNSIIYEASIPPDYADTINDTEAKRLSKIETDSVYIDPLRSSWLLQPVFLDSVSSHAGLFGSPTSLVRPGRHRILVHALSVTSGISSYLKFECDFKMATTYSPTAIYENERLTIKIRNAKESQSACNEVEYAIPLPSFRK